jgi:hypothetical protein
MSRRNEEQVRNCIRSLVHAAALASIAPDPTTIARKEEVIQAARELDEYIGPGLKVGRLFRVHIDLKVEATYFITDVLGTRVRLIWFEPLSHPGTMPYRAGQATVNKIMSKDKVRQLLRNADIVKRAQSQQMNPKHEETKVSR